jgi:hypothetical protein
MGAAHAADPAPAAAADYDARVTAEDRRHWSFLPVQRPPLPQVSNADWARNPIDRFILARLESRGWQPNPAAEPRQFLRRLYWDLVGLPPDPDEIDAYLSDPSVERRERAADRLLANPAFGERWGRHWLDLVRYAESNGYERDGAKPHVWRFRDYVIQSLNADKPFDRFLTEQIAGDELPDADAETILALGYYRLGPWDDEPADPVEDRFDQLDDMLSTTSQVFLGLTLGCARCHNHKFEPLTQLDYYRMVAIFRPLERFQNGRADLDALAGSRQQLAEVARRDEQIAELTARISALRAPVRAMLLATDESRLPADAVAAFKTAAEARNDAQKKLVEKHAAELDAQVTRALSEEARAQQETLEQEIAGLRRRTPDLPRGYFMRENGGTVPATHVLLRGKPGRPGIAVKPGVPAVLAERQPEFLPADRHTSRRRLSLARWIASPRNPLTARVIVNRVWQYHMGEGLVRTSSDFGVMGDEPSHPELLDWLADWFVREGWSLKKLHRLIVTSNTYGMSTAWRADYAREDPENRLRWRFAYRRLEVEPLRDGMLKVSGRLNRVMMGPPMYPFVPPEALAGSSDPDKIWPAYQEIDSSRRTVYAFIKRSLVVPMLEVLDLCDTTKSSAQRSVTSVAPQALTLFNGQFVNEQALHLARRLKREVGDHAEAQISRAWRLALGRLPTQFEQQQALQFLQSEVNAAIPADGPAAADALQAAREQALVQLCRVLLNSNEFAYPD